MVYIEDLLCFVYYLIFCKDLITNYQLIFVRSVCYLLVHLTLDQANEEHFNTYKFSKPQEQHGETPDERWKREKESDKNFFKECFNRVEKRQTKKKHKRQTKKEEFKILTKAYRFWNKEAQQYETKEETAANKKKRRKHSSMHAKKKKRKTDNHEGSEEGKDL